MFVLTINQRDTLDAGDRVDTFLRALQDVPGLGDAVVLPFQRAVGDELIGAVEDPRVAVDVALRALRRAAGTWGSASGR